jgi:hypothetical protein
MKKRFLSFALLGFATLMFFSCVVKQEVYFNRDFSGNYKYTYDFTEYVSYMEGEEDSMKMKNEDFEEYLQSVITSLKGIDGISDIKFLNDADNGVVYFAYKFAHVDALNQALKYSSYMDQEPLENAPQFIQKKKTLTFVRTPAPVEETEQDTATADTDYMNDMFKWEFTIEFEGDMKKYDVQKDTAVTISNDNRKFVEGGNAFDAAAKESKWVFKTK